MTIAQDRPASAIDGSVEAAPAGLDWQAFSTRNFPRRRRHDLEALRAYGAYKERADEGSAEVGSMQIWEREGGRRPGEE
jgi:hypothetical protein